MLHFVDNQGALSCLVNGCFRAGDMGAIATLYQILMAKMSCRVWAEYVESSANCSDGPSRDGDEWRFHETCRALGATVIRARLPKLEKLKGTPLVELLNLFPVEAAVRGSAVLSMDGI